LVHHEFLKKCKKNVKKIKNKFTNKIPCAIINYAQWSYAEDQKTVEKI